MNASQYAAKLKIEMDKVMASFVDPGYPDFEKYRSAVARWQALDWAHKQLTLSEGIDDDD